MAFFSKLQSWFSPLPGELSKVVYDTAYQAGIESFKGFFQGKRGIAKLGALWVPMFLKLSRATGQPMTEEEADLLFGKLCALLNHVDGNLDLQEMRPNHAAGAALPIAIRLSRDGFLTLVYGRAAAHILLKYNGDLTVDELAVTIAGLGAAR